MEVRVGRLFEGGALLGVDVSAGPARRLTRRASLPAATRFARVFKREDLRPSCLDARGAAPRPDGRGVLGVALATVAAGREARRFASAPLAAGMGFARARSRPATKLVLGASFVLDTSESERLAICRGSWRWPIFRREESELQASAGRRAVCYYQRSSARGSEKSLRRQGLR